MGETYNHMIIHEHFASSVMALLSVSPFVDDLAPTLTAVGPVLGRWNAFLEHRFPLRSLTSPKRINGNALLKRVLCDQLIV